MTVTTNWSGSFNGLAFGVGSNVQLSLISGLRGIPALRSGDALQPRRDGANAGLDLLGERVFTVDLLPFNPSVPFEQVVSSIATAFQPIMDPSNQMPFELLLPGWDNSRIINCRPTNGATDIDQNFQYANSMIPVELTANDPLIYSSVLKTAAAGLPSPTAGLAFPVTFPVTFGSSTGGSVAVTNAGNYITAPVVTINGPMTKPMITFTSTGQFMAFNITLADGDVFVVDMANRLVTLNGAGYRFNTVVTGSTWLGIPPGAWSIGLSSSDSAAVGGNFSIAYRDAWGWM